jgi:hypothetical protein
MSRGLDKLDRRMGAVRTVGGSRALDKLDQRRDAMRRRVAGSRQARPAIGGGVQVGSRGLDGLDRRSAEFVRMGQRRRGFPADT